MPGPMKEDKLTPRITETAKALWLIYIALTVACTLSYWALGMSPFDAVTQAFSTIATGGFANYDDSLGHFHSHGILIVAIVFMWVSGASFSLHFISWRARSLRPYLNGLEFQVYTAILAAACVVVAITLYAHATFHSFGQDMLQGAFQVVSIMTSTGFASAHFSLWPTFVPILLMLLACIGGCAGSTAGGIKVIRLTLLFKQAWREIVSMVHPNAELPVKLGKRLVPERRIKSVWAFFFIYVMGFTVMVLVLMALGLSGLTAFSAVAACTSNEGPALGQAAANFIPIGPAPKWVLIFAMIGGRLEIFTLLIIITPAFWRR
jgi:trk system potassium uptake protein TrkH